MASPFNKGGTWENWKETTGDDFRMKGSSDRPPAVLIPFFWEHGSMIPEEQLNDSPEKYPIPSIIIYDNLWVSIVNTTFSCKAMLNPNVMHCW
jgi:hypothetical protein